MAFAMSIKIRFGSESLATNVAYVLFVSVMTVFVIVETLTGSYYFSTNITNIFFQSSFMTLSVFSKGVSALINSVANFTFVDTLYKIWIVFF